MRLKKVFALLFAASLLASACVSCEKQKKKEAAPPAISVATAEERVVPLVFETYGLVEAYAQLSVKSKLTGKIVKLGFEPGQKLAKGDLLVQLDDREYQADLKKYQAQFDKNKILYEDAQRIYRMKADLAKSNAVTQTEMITQKATAESLGAALREDEADIENTRLNIEYCHIVAPFDGVVGDILIHAGSIVKMNDDTIVKLMQIKPAYVAFSLPERMLSSIRALQAGGKRLEIIVKIPSDKCLGAIKGELSFIDNDVDTSSGTIKTKAFFKNEDERLWPGQYVNVSVMLSEDERFVAVPTDAIMSGQEGQQVFIVKPDSTVELRHVEPLRSYEGFTAVKEVSAGEKTVLTGQFRLAPGMAVSVKSEAKGEQGSK